MRILADSGILLRLYHTVDPRHLAVRRTVAALELQWHDLVTTPQNIAEFWNVCTRPATARGGFGLSFAEAERRLQAVERGFTLIIDRSTTYRLWRALVLRHQVQGKQVHDARLAAVMLSHGITHILTLNGRDFVRYPGITVIDPLNFAATPYPIP